MSAGALTAMLTPPRAAFTLPNFYLGGADGRRVFVSTAERPADGVVCEGTS